jgi:hypothetical protein
VSDIEFQADFRPDEDFAIAMDERDALKDFRGRFFFPTIGGGDGVYLCGHSLGL